MRWWKSWEEYDSRAISESPQGISSSKPAGMFVCACAYVNIRETSWSR